MNETERDAYYLRIAADAAEAATCPRRKVGAVVVAANRRISMGFNGSPKGTPECTEVGCLMALNHCMRVVHAEINALIIAGSDAQGAVLYTTCPPCWECAKVIINAGVRRVVSLATDYQDVRGDMSAEALFAYAGVSTFSYRK